MKTYQLLLMLAVWLGMGSCATQNPDQWSESKLNDFCHKNPFFTKLAAKPSTLTDKREFAREYVTAKKEWDKALEFLQRKDLADLKPGKYPLTDKTFANVQEYETRLKGDYECHRQYTDVQYIVEGNGEKCWIAPLQSMTGEVTPYDPKGDYALYSQTAEGKETTINKQTYGIYFPSDAHKPNMALHGKTAKGKKIVVKVWVANQK